MIKTNNRVPEVCPICGAVVKKVIHKLMEGSKHAFIFEETCPINEHHYSHLRWPSLNEMIGE